MAQERVGSRAVSVRARGEDGARRARSRRGGEENGGIPRRGGAGDGHPLEPPRLPREGRCLVSERRANRTPAAASSCASRNATRRRKVGTGARVYRGRRGGRRSRGERTSSQGDLLSRWCALNSFSGNFWLHCKHRSHFIGFGASGTSPAGFIGVRASSMGISTDLSRGSLGRRASRTAPHAGDASGGRRKTPAPLNVCVDRDFDDVANFKPSFTVHPPRHVPSYAQTVTSHQRLPPPVRWLGLPKKISARAGAIAIQ